MRWSLFIVLAVAACEPGYTVDATVFAPPAAVGRPLVVFEYGSAHLDADAVLPTPNKDWGLLVAFAGVPDAYPLLVSDSSLGCPDALFMAAWVDVDDSQGIAALLGGRTFNPGNYENDDDRKLLKDLAKLAPEPGDLIGLGGPLDFGMDTGSCKHRELAVDVMTAPLTSVAADRASP